ncbi:MAG: UDP-galactopyranose mutase [bacterium]
MKILIVGAGITGSTISNIIANKGHYVTIIDKKDHIAGNCFDCISGNNLWIQKYGPHIFHTKNSKVWEFLKRFTQFNDYVHKVMVNDNGKYITMPINLDTLESLYNRKLDKKSAKDLIEKEKKPIENPSNSEEMVLSLMGEVIYEKLFKNYTLKQWGIPASQLKPDVTARIPLRFDRDDRYFAEPYQGIPVDGFTCMVNNMLNHKKISIILNTPFNHEMSKNYDLTIYTGPIDEFFSYKYGKLSYRSLDLVFEEHDIEYFQPYAVVNYPNTEFYTRISEFKYFYKRRHLNTIICKEFSKNEGDPFYPVQKKENIEISNKYLSLANKRTIFAGRLGTFKYLNIDTAVEKAIDIAYSII